MKRIHHDVTSICAFISTRKLVITKIRAGKQRFKETASPHDLAEMLEKSNTLWGTKLDYFFFVSDGDAPDNIDLANVVSSVESGAIPGFILVAYQDGGVISVSNKPYPFQEDAEPAAWWYVL
ncbi:hypothetical protein [Pleomorphomonas sp. PLEO]|uniref:hypothetical protein n=1 Tax=Pleomorphomonas sp. PLEO TaxID=3239306 RepID=UPI00351F5F92